MNLAPYLKRRRIIYALCFLAFLSLICLFSVRGIILRKAIASINARSNRYNLVTHWDGAGFKGLRTVFVKGIYIESKKDGNEIYIDSVALRMRILPLFLKQIRIRKLDCKTISIHYTTGDSLILPKNVEQQDTAHLFDLITDKDIAGFFYKNIRRFFSFIPSRMNFGQIEARVRYKGSTTICELRDFQLERGVMTAFLKLTGNGSTLSVPFEGRLDKTASVIELNLYNADSALLPAPLLSDKYGISAGFDTLKFRIDLAQRNRHLIKVNGYFVLTGLKLTGNRLSTDEIKIDQLKSSFRVNIGDNFIELDSLSRAYLNNIRLNPYIKLTLKRDPAVIFRLLPVTWNAGDFFGSLPEGMFTSLTGLKAEGKLHYFLNFSVDLGNPDSLLFQTELKGEAFKISAFGIDDYRKLNGSFLHKVYERGRLVASFVVGSENPDFVALNEISPFLRAAVMTSEDGTFYYHHGFNPNAFRESIVTNIKERRFARGGSTISMQLVKNVFLTRNKTLARKIEEALIVWLIENKNIVSKQRMYEVYLNMIEWGPGIYGINQASRFYFNKKPAGLNLQESIYLASIVPHPKWYKYSFVTNGVLRPFYQSYFNRLSELMVRKGFIAPGDTLGVRPPVMLEGNAANAFSIANPIEMDSVNVEELDFIPVF